MNDVEKKLAKYRARREQEARYNKFKANLQTKLALYFAKKTIRTDEESTECLLKLETDEENETIKDNLSDVDALSTDDDSITLNCCTYMDYVYYILCLILWATVYVIFVKIQFGTVYLILSILIGIYLNTRTGPKAKGEISAYSVFNKGCKSIDGTLKAEQFEQEIRYGPSTIR